MCENVVLSVVVTVSARLKSEEIDQRKASGLWGRVFRVYAHAARARAAAPVQLHENVRNKCVPRKLSQDSIAATRLETKSWGVPV